MTHPGHRQSVVRRLPHRSRRCRSTRRKADRREANLPTQHAQAGEAPRLPPPHVLARRPGDPEGETAQGASSADGVSGALSGPGSAMAAAIGRIRTRSSFRALARPDGRASSGPVRVAYVRDSAEPPAMACVAYALGRRHGNAVARNRLRRRLRAVAREIATGGELAPGAYLVSAGPAVAGLGCDALRAALRDAMTGAACCAPALRRAGAPASGAVGTGARGHGGARGGRLGDGDAGRMDVDAGRAGADAWRAGGDAHRDLEGRGQRAMPGDGHTQDGHTRTVHRATSTAR